MTSEPSGSGAGGSRNARHPGPPPGDAWTLVRASGDIDLAAVPELDRVLRAAVPPDQRDRHLVLDLAAVTFLNGSGLRPLLRARRRLAERFWLANPSRQVRSLLDLAALTGSFAIIEDLPQLTLVAGRGAGTGLVPHVVRPVRPTVPPRQVGPVGRGRAPVVGDLSTRGPLGDGAG